MTAIVDAAADQDDESLIEPGQMVVTITRDGFIKRTALDAFRQQNPRRARAARRWACAGDDVVTRSFNAHTHQWVLFFSSGGKAFREKVWRLPEAQPAAKGRALVNLLPDLGGDTITTVLPLPQDETPVGEFAFAVRHRQAAACGATSCPISGAYPRLPGMIAMKLDEGDHLVGVCHLPRGAMTCCSPPARGAASALPITDDVVRVFAGRDSAGVRGIKLRQGGRGDQPVHPAARGSHARMNAPPSCAALRPGAGRRARRWTASVEADAEAEDAHHGRNRPEVSAERLEDMERREELLLTVTNAGFGKR